MAHRGTSVGNWRFRRLRDMHRNYFNLRVEYQLGAHDWHLNQTPIAQHFAQYVTKVQASFLSSCSHLLYNSLVLNMF